MDLVNRYLEAVRFWLPKGQQDDIVAELGEDLRSQMEERETASGHPLDEDGIAAILRERGHPMKVACQYRSARPLIGPEWIRPTTLCCGWWFSTFSCRYSR